MTISFPRILIANISDDRIIRQTVATELIKGLGKNLDLRCYTIPNDDYSEQAVNLPVGAAKGVEFDAAIFINGLPAQRETFRSMLLFCREFAADLDSPNRENCIINYHCPLESTNEGLDHLGINTAPKLELHPILTAKHIAESMIARLQNSVPP